MVKTSKATKSSNRSLSRAQVLAYLRAHPDFFALEDPKVDELMQQLVLPSDDQGNNISLLGYQNRLLVAARDKWLAERHQATSMHTYNRDLMLKIHLTCLNLLRASKLQELGKILDAALVKELRVEHYALLLFARAPASSFYRRVAPTTMMRAAYQLLQKRGPTVGRAMDPDLQTALFTKAVPWASSYLCLPLHGPRRCLGGLCLLSADADRFGSRQDMHLIQFFQEVLALALYQCLTKNKK